MTTTNNTSAGSASERDRRLETALVEYLEALPTGRAVTRAAGALCRGQTAADAVECRDESHRFTAGKRTPTG